MINFQNGDCSVWSRSSIDEGKCHKAGMHEVENKKKRRGGAKKESD